MTSSPAAATEPGFIHPLAVVEEGARLGAGVSIGPFTYVGQHVTLGDNVQLMNNVTVIGETTIGEGTVVHPQAVIGGEPQNVKHKGGLTKVVVGRNCVFREFVTINRGTDTDRGETTVGDNCMMMAYAHIAHDCVVGDNVTMSNNATLGGHCVVGDNVIFGGLAFVHQFVRIGRNAFLGGVSATVRDVIPFGMVMGNRSTLRGLNLVGMRRAGIGQAERSAVKAAYMRIFDRGRPVAENLAELRGEEHASPIVTEIVDFLSAQANRPFCVPPVRGGQLHDDGAD